MKVRLLGGSIGFLHVSQRFLVDTMVAERGASTVDGRAEVIYSIERLY